MAQKMTTTELQKDLSYKHVSVLRIDFFLTEINKIMEDVFTTARTIRSFYVDNYHVINDKITRKAADNFLLYSKKNAQLTDFLNKGFS